MLPWEVCVHYASGGGREEEESSGVAVIANACSIRSAVFLEEDVRAGLGKALALPAVSPSTGTWAFSFSFLR